MTPSRPYLLRAVFDWLIDNDMTPYLLVDAEIDFVDVPLQFVEDGRIILNASPSATQGLAMENDAVYFSARFGGRPHNIYIPIAAVLAIYSKETGQGSMFKDEEGLTKISDDNQPPPPPSPKTDDKNTKKRPNLRVVK